MAERQQTIPPRFAADVANVECKPENPMTWNPRSVLPIALLFSLLQAMPVAAEDSPGIFDRIDLNEYALGLNFYRSESRYAGVDAFNVVFPSPQKYRNVLLSDEMTYIRKGNFGIRRVSDSGWTVGGILNFQSYGYGSNVSPSLVGMARRNWTLQGGALIGKRVGQFVMEVDASADLLGEHNGYEASLDLVWIKEFRNVEIAPEVSVTYESAKLLNHYFGVRTSEALPDRPAYLPGAAITYSGSVDASWRFHDKWYVSAMLAYDHLPKEITNSPIVNKDSPWRVMLSLAYDAAAFVEPSPLSESSIWDVSVGGFFAEGESNIDFIDNLASDGGNLENAGLDRRKTAFPVEINWRQGRYHRVEFEYMNLQRSGEDNGVSQSFDSQTIKLGYGVSFLRDQQKDVALFGGLQVTKLDFVRQGGSDPKDASTTSYMPLLGARASARLTPKLSFGASLDLFLLDFDKHSGESIDFEIFGAYHFTDRFAVEGGYRFIRQDVDSGDRALLGDYRIDYRGFFATLRTYF